MMIPGQKVIYDIVREKVVVKEVNVERGNMLEGRMLDFQEHSV